MVARNFRPGLIPWLAVLILLPLLLWLGQWQYQRYVDRSQEHDKFAAAPSQFTALSEVDVATVSDYQWVSAQGRYDGERQFLIDNMVRQSRNGFFVITPFQLVDGRWLLVNRGWVVQDPARRVLPDVSLTTSGQSELRGRLGRLPSAGIKLASEPPPPDLWPSIRQFPDIAELSTALGVPLASRIVLLAADAADGYHREWRPGGLPPARHLGYAVQWFALALTLLIIALVLSFRKSSDE